MLRMPQTELEYRNALIDAAEAGATKALMDVGLLKPYLKLRESYRLYGEAIVNRWIKEGLVRVIKDGTRNASVRIDRLELLTVARTANRATYLTAEERKG
ncbi:MAG: hypothetical protein RBT74_17350 [Tenuifilaceae bacterium]|jgi:hypothetical protein|nr:hypothetical protein [Tenuifilaceae bacterium]